jgi:hypothetical protein
MRSSLRLATFIIPVTIMTTNAMAQQLVPFVGCPGGDMTSFYAPFQGKPVSVDMDASSAAHLAFYAANPSVKKVGVIAPRGWHCNFQDASGAFSLVVVPYFIQPPLDFAERDTPQISLFMTYNGTSGRSGVANDVKTYFPKLDPYVADTLNEEKQISGGAEAPPSPGSGIPYPTDSYSYLDADTLVFLTPSHSIGLGTGPREMSVLPTYGFLNVYLQDEYVEFTVLFRERLPPNLMFLKTEILNDERRRVKEIEAP